MIIYIKINMYVLQTSGLTRFNHPIGDWMGMQRQTFCDLRGVEASEPWSPGTVAGRQRLDLAITSSYHIKWKKTINLTPEKKSNSHISPKSHLRYSFSGSAEWHKQFCCCQQHGFPPKGTGALRALRTTAFIAVFWRLALLEIGDFASRSLTHWEAAAILLSI